MREIVEKYIEFEKWWGIHGRTLCYGYRSTVLDTPTFRDFVHWLVKGEPKPEDKNKGL